MAALKHRHISPHTFVHLMAMGLLEAGIATEVIALFLDHETAQMLQRGRGCADLSVCPFYRRECNKSHHCGGRDGTVAS